ncbi:MAG: hypothetical protein RL385_1654 [Pseudomonadota bacterium]|jgi:hypothetical protein
MSNTIKTTILALAIGATSLAAAPDADAATWSNVVYQNNQTTWRDGAVDGQLWTGSRLTRLLTYAASNNLHTGGVFAYCNGYPMHGYPTGAQTRWYGSAVRHEYYCPGTSSLNRAQAWVGDI